MVFEREVIEQKISDWKKEGLKVGFTSGVFDLLHAGHLDYLQNSKDFCDILIVGINADSSVKSNKGVTRPIVSEKHRSELVAGLKPVDAVFIFTELNNNVNIKVLKPDLYIKAGDYDPSRLSSAPLIRAQGGDVKIIPVVNNISSSKIIEKIQMEALTEHDVLPKGKQKPVVFLDRDGVINKEVSYLHDPKKFELTETCLEGMTRLAKLDCTVIVVTNQAGIGLGYFDHEDLFRVNQEMFKQLKPSGIKIDKIYYCPHGFSEKCTCRKPNTGMLEKAFKNGSLKKEGSFIIGDQATDIEAGKNFGIKTILLSNTKKDMADYCVTTFSDAVSIIEKSLC